MLYDTYKLHDQWYFAFAIYIIHRATKLLKSADTEDLIPVDIAYVQE